MRYLHDRFEMLAAHTYVHQREKLIVTEALEQILHLGLDRKLEGIYRKLQIQGLAFLMLPLFCVVIHKSDHRWHLARVLVIVNYAH